MGISNNWGYSWFMFSPTSKCRTQPNNTAKIRVINLALEGAETRWMVILHNYNAPELWNFNWFMTALKIDWQTGKLRTS